MARWGVAAVVAASACGGGSSGPTGPDARAAIARGTFIVQRAGMQSGVASAEFFTRSAEFCTDTRAGACVLHHCSVDAFDAGAGVLTIDGGPAPISMSEGGNHTYTAFVSGHPPFEDGNVLVFHATGGDVPAFTTSLIVPTHTTVTAPAKPVDINGSIAIDRTRGFEVTWTGGAPGMISVRLTSQSGALDCRYAAAAESALVSSDALALLAAGDGHIYINSVSAIPVRVSDWDIVVSATDESSWNVDGTYANAAITLH